MDYPAKQFTIRINGSNYQIVLEDQFDQLVKKLGLEINIQHKVKNIKAPMPGLVVTVPVEEGQEVKEGDVLLILESMKMQNELKAPRDGVVGKVLVSPGDSVDQRQKMLSVE